MMRSWGWGPLGQVLGLSGEQAPAQPGVGSRAAAPEELQPGGEASTLSQRPWSPCCLPRPWPG